MHPKVCKNKEKDSYQLKIALSVLTSLFTEKHIKHPLSVFRLFGNSGACSACGQSIPASELVMRAQGNVYHLKVRKCFFLMLSVPPWKVPFLHLDLFQKKISISSEFISQGWLIVNGKRFLKMYKLSQWFVEQHHIWKRCWILTSVIYSFIWTNLSIYISISIYIHTFCCNTMQSPFGILTPKFTFAFVFTQCFTCSTCRNRLVPGDRFHYINGSLFCEHDRPTALINGHLNSLQSNPLLPDQKVTFQQLLIGLI